MVKSLITMNDKWLKLTISTNEKSDYEIVSSFLMKDSMGSIIKNRSSTIFFNLEFENQLKDRINRLKNKFKLNKNGEGCASVVCDYFCCCLLFLIRSLFYDRNLINSYHVFSALRKTFPEL